MPPCRAPPFDSTVGVWAYLLLLVLLVASGG